MKNILYQSDRPRKIKFYYPFLIASFFLGLGVILLFIYKPDNGIPPHLSKVFLGLAVLTFIFEMLIMKFVFPADQLKLEHRSDKIYLKLYKGKIIEKQMEVKDYSYFWSYAFNHPSLKEKGETYSSSMGSGEIDEGYSSKAGANTIDLYVILNFVNEDRMVLFREGNYINDDIPKGWSYSLTDGIKKEELVDASDLDNLPIALNKSFLEEVKYFPLK